MKLTAAQRRILAKLAANGGNYTFDGTRHSSFAILATKGLITWTYKVVPESLHGRHQLWHVVTLTEKGKEAA